MRLATAADIKRLDERAEREFGLSRIVLMENAGLAVVLAMERVLGSMEGRRVTVLCGRGGNGGDGLCAARHLVSHGASVVVGCVGGREGLQGETLANWKILDRMGLRPRDVAGDADLPWVRAAAGAGDYVVDALLGVGARLPLDGTMRAVVEAVNASGRPVVAVDLPTGMDADRGTLEGTCVRASLTVTLGLPKPGQVLYPATELVGKLVVADLSFPADLLNDPAMTMDVLLQSEAAQLAPVLPRRAHKHVAGRVMLVAGSRAMTGAAVLAGRGALVSGAGMVYVASPASAAAGLHGRVPELLLEPQPETPGGGLAADATALVERAAGMHAVGIGPGLGREAATLEAVRALAERLDVPVLLDADALAAVAGRPGTVRRDGVSRVLTPHAGEMARLLGTTAETVELDRPAAVRAAAESYGAIVVLKGARTLVAEPAGRCFVIPPGNPGMATAGTGDVLAGVITGLMAARVPPLSAALLGAYLHGLAGDVAAEKRSEAATTASAVLDEIPSAWLRLTGRDRPAGHADRS